MQTTLFLLREPFGRALKLNLSLPRPFSLSISAQGDLFLLRQADGHNMCALIACQKN